MPQTRKGIILNQIGKKVRELSGLLNVPEKVIKHQMADYLDRDVRVVRNWCLKQEIDPGIEIYCLLVLFFKKKGMKITIDDLIINKLEELAEDLDMTLPDIKTA